MIGSVEQRSSTFRRPAGISARIGHADLGKGLAVQPWRYSIGPKIEVDFRKSTMRTFKNLERPLRVLEDARRSSVMRKPLSITFIVKKNRTGWSMTVRFTFFRK